MSGFRLPHLDQQFDPRDATSNVDCTATVGAILADADSGGVFAFTHSQVRAATNEARPDPASPGLNWTQIDAAVLKLTAGKVNLDVHPVGSAFEALKAAVTAGRWAGISVWRDVFVKAGFGGASSFREGHAEVLGYHPTEKRLYLGDPLVRTWQHPSWAVVEEACRAFIVRVGGGAGAQGAYFALTRDVYDAPPAKLRYSAAFTAGAFFQYQVINGRITGRHTEVWKHDTSAPCTAPDTFPWTLGGERKLVRLTAGARDGAYVEPGSTNVRLVVTK